MNGFPDRIISPKGKRNIGDTTANFGVWKICFNPSGSFKKIDCIFAMFIHSRCNGKNIGIKNDILWKEMHFINQDIIGTFTDIDSALVCIGLTLFIKCHYYDSGPISFNFFCMGAECFFPFLHGNGIHNTFTLHAFQSCFNHTPLRRIDHDGKFRNVGFCSYKI
ncbi:MAG: hypothetical protein BWY67_01175 [Bacteroidetes bacterium ADurb.Bin397]|nr:MAG: hypothetical protein BWY67_01175 [Bacteroidetes bacterium ADurb.Bin397]